MNEIERIRDLDDEIFVEFKRFFPKTINSNFKTQFPKTSYLSTILDIGGAFIKNSIFNNCEIDNYYGAKILFRSLIEHFIQFQYIFINWAKTKSDEFAKRYLEFGEAREELDLIKAKVFEQKLYNPNFKIEDWNTFLSKFPSFKNKTKTEVESETKKYTFKKIVKFLTQELQKGEQQLSPFLGKLIAEYSNLSSFVHGGVKSYEEMMSMNSQDKREAEYGRICGLSFQASNSIKLFTVLMYVQTDGEDFKGHYLRIDEIMKKLNK